MSIYHDEVEIEDFEYDEEDETYYYPCPCGDRFQITKVCTFSYMCIFMSPTFHFVFCFCVQKLILAKLKPANAFEFE